MKCSGPSSSNDEKPGIDDSDSIMAKVGRRKHFHTCRYSVISGIWNWIIAKILGVIEAPYSS